MAGRKDEEILDEVTDGGLRIARNHISEAEERLEKAAKRLKLTGNYEDLEDESLEFAYPAAKYYLDAMNGALRRELKKRRQN